MWPLVPLTVHSSKYAVLSTQCDPAAALAQELTRHAANLGMIAAATANPLRSKHFYLGFQAEHKLAAASAQAPCISTALCLITMGFGQADCLAELCMHWCNLQPRVCFPRARGGGPAIPEGLL